MHATLSRGDSLLMVMMYDGSKIPQFMAANPLVSRFDYCNYAVAICLSPLSCGCCSHGLALL